MSGKSSIAVQDGVDRRVRRTRAALQQALIETLARKPYEQITVEDICEAANVGRSTFYAHYRSKEDLKRGAIDDHLGRELAERRTFSDVASPTLIILEHVRDHRRLHRSMASRGASVAIDAIRQSLMQTLHDDMSDRGERAFEREFRVQFVVGAFMAVLVWWLERGAHEPPEQVEMHFQTLSTRGVTPAG